jgi:hypothetical protein
MAADKKPEDSSKGRAHPDRSGSPRSGKPHRNPAPSSGSSRRPPTPPAAPRTRSDSKPKPATAPKPMIGLPMAAEGRAVPEAAIDGVVYIAYGEHGDDVAFELSEDLQEAIEILEQMRDDGFRAKLYQAHEIDDIIK